MKLRQAAIGLLLCMLVGVFLFSGWKLYATLSEYKKGTDSYDRLTRDHTSRRETQPLPTLPPSGETLPGEETVPGETAPITVDFETLLAECPDVVGWLYCEDTPINYPIVQADDNDYYLYRLLDGTWNSSGSLFLDYRCESGFSGWNSIVYGHNMKNDSMFGTLQDYKKQEYYDAHPVLYLLTPAQDYKIELLGGYTVPGTASDTYGLPDTQEGRDRLIAKARENSTFHAETAVQDGQGLITLSTCAYEYDNARYVLTGVLKPLSSAVAAAAAE